MAEDLGKTSSGLEPNMAGLLAYVLGLVSGLILFLTEKENTFVRFHAMQSICLSVGLLVASVVLSLMPVIGVALAILLRLIGAALWIVCMIKAYQGEWFRLPVVGDIAAKQAGI